MGGTDILGKVAAPPGRGAQSARTGTRPHWRPTGRITLTRTITVFLLGAAGIAAAAIFVRWALPAPPLVTAFYRVALATVLLWLWLAARGRARRPPPAAFAPALLAGVCFGLDLGLWSSSLVLTSVANATLLVNTTPVFVGVYALLFERESLSGRFLAGAALALAGTGVLLGSNLGSEDSLRGDAMALTAAVFYSAYLLLMKSVRRGLDTPRAVATAGLSAAATLGAAAALRGDPFTGFPLQSWLCFVASAVVSHLGGVLGIVWALRRLRATFAAVALLAQPVGAAALGWWLLAEPLGPVQALGGAAVLGGILLASGSAGDSRSARSS